MQLRITITVEVVLSVTVVEGTSVRTWGSMDTARKPCMAAVLSILLCHLNIATLLLLTSVSTIYVFVFTFDIRKPRLKKKY